MVFRDRSIENKTISNFFKLASVNSKYNSCNILLICFQDKYPILEVSMIEHN